LYINIIYIQKYIFFLLINKYLAKIITVSSLRNIIDKILNFNICNNIYYFLYE